MRCSGALHWKRLRKGQPLLRRLPGWSFTEAQLLSLPIILGSQGKGACALSSQL